jgi:hypothetical protein
MHTHMDVLEKVLTHIKASGNLQAPCWGSSVVGPCWGISLLILFLYIRIFTGTRMQYIVVIYLKLWEEMYFLLLKYFFIYLFIL